MKRLLPAIILMVVFVPNVLSQQLDLSIKSGVETPIGILRLNYGNGFTVSADATMCISDYNYENYIGLKLMGVGGDVCFSRFAPLNDKLYLINDINNNTVSQQELIFTDLDLMSYCADIQFLIFSSEKFHILMNTGSGITHGFGNVSRSYDTPDNLVFMLRFKGGFQFDYMLSDRMGVRLDVTGNTYLNYNFGDDPLFYTYLYDHDSKFTFYSIVSQAGLFIKL